MQVSLHLDVLVTVFICSRVVRSISSCLGLSLRPFWTQTSWTFIASLLAVRCLGQPWGLYAVCRPAPSGRQASWTFIVSFLAIRCLGQPLGLYAVCRPAPSGRQASWTFIVSLLAVRDAVALWALFVGDLHAGSVGGSSLKNYPGYNQVSCAQQLQNNYKTTIKQL